MIDSDQALATFQDSIRRWHLGQKPAENPFVESTIKFLLFKKNQIDTIQWHYEDEIRRDDLPPRSFIQLKRDIDRLNQARTDTVEQIDDQFLAFYHPKPVLPGAWLHSETPAWLLDRMSILELKIYHMAEQVSRPGISAEHQQKARDKEQILLQQRQDLSGCFDALRTKREEGLVYFKVYRQMKMYNDSTLNPALYEKKPS